MIGKVQKNSIQLKYINYNIINIFTVALDGFIAFLLNKSINLFLPKKTFEL